MVDEKATRAAEAMRELLYEELQSRFKGDLKFGPIVVLPGMDQDGDRYLHAYIVFDGDQKKLDPRWTMRLHEAMWPVAREFDYPAIPLSSFVAKSEWTSQKRKLRKLVSDEQLV